MIASIVSAISTLAGLVLSTAATITSYWVVSAMVAMLIIGLAVGWIIRLVGGRKKRRR